MDWQYTIRNFDEFQSGQLIILILKLLQLLLIKVVYSRKYIGSAVDCITLRQRLYEIA